MADMTTIRVNELVAKLTEEGSSKIKRFSKNDFRDLVFAVLSDKEFKAKKYLLKNDGFEVEEISYNEAMRKFMDKLLKHAGISESSERAQVLDTFEYSSKDTEWICDAVDEAIHLYVDCGKNMRMFRDKMQVLTISKMVRSGNYAGKVTFKKSVLDRAAALAKREK